MATSSLPNFISRDTLRVKLSILRTPGSATTAKTTHSLLMKNDSKIEMPRMRNKQTILIFWIKVPR